MRWAPNEPDVLKLIVVSIHFLVLNIDFRAALNRGGRTLFVENDPSWVNTTLGACPDCLILIVQYSTTLKEHGNALVRGRSFSTPPCVLPTNRLLCSYILTARYSNVKLRESCLYLTRPHRPHEIVKVRPRPSRDAA